MTEVKKYTEDQIVDKIKEHIVKEFFYDRPNDVLLNDSPLIEAGMNDSLGIFLLAEFLEKEFGFTLNPEEFLLENFETVNAIKSLVVSKLQ
jgi:acyl carrier protein